jgi:hypothetical protein
MDGQPSRLASRPGGRVPTSQPATSLLPVRWAAALGAGWPLAIIAAMALEPVPADPDAPVPLIIELGGLALFLGLVTTAVAAGVRHRGAAVAGVITGLLATTFTVTCPVSGHHAFGLRWVAQLGVVTTMLAASLVALGRSSH